MMNEFFVWVDNIRLISLTSVGKVNKGAAAVGIDDFDDGPHLLTLALYSRENANQVSIWDLVKLVAG